MKKLLLSIGLFGLFLLCGTSAQAAGPTRGAKASVALSYTTTVSTVSARGPAVLYSVILSTGASGEFVALFDSATVNGLASGTLTNMKTRCVYASTSANTQCNFDPPLQFVNGIMAAPSAATGQALIVYEIGRIVNGY